MTLSDYVKKQNRLRAMFHAGLIDEPVYRIKWVKNYINYFKGE